MHCMLAWGREQGGDQLTDEENRKLEQALDGHSWASPGPGIYVVALTYGPSERIELRKKLKSKIKEEGLKGVVYLLSPPIDKGSGYYIGAAKNENWVEINRRSGHVQFTGPDDDEVSEA